MRQGFRVAIPGKDASTAIPKEVITDTSLISLPIHWEGAFSISATGGVGVAALTASGTVTHDLGYCPLTRAWCSSIVTNGTDWVEDSTQKLSLPVVKNGFLLQVYGFADRISIKCVPSAPGVTGAAYTLHGYLYIFEYKPTGLVI